MRTLRPFLPLAVVASTLAACGSQGATKPAPSASASAASSPFDDLKDTDKLLMGRWGQLVLAQDFSNDDSLTPNDWPAFTADVTSARRGEGGETEGRVLVGHEDAPGTETPEPDLKHFVGSDVKAMACPHLTTTTTDLVLKSDIKAKVLCAHGSFGDGIVATARKSGRVVHFVCAELAPDGVGRCVGYLKTLAPG